MCLITELTAPECSAWDAYVETAAAGLPQHLSGWRDILYETNRYETRYLLARQGERIVGVMPLFVVRSVLVGNRAMTMPGGLCADSETAAAALILRATEIARRAGAGRLVIQDTRRVWPAGLQTETHHVHRLLPLEREVETLWLRLDGNIRRQVRLARRNNLTVEIDRTGIRLGMFYDLFSRFTHQLGTPVFGRNFLEHVIAIFPNNFTIAVVCHAGQPVGAYFQLLMNRTVYGVWGASLPQHRALRPAYLAYWEILADACRRGYRCLDMGRSPTGSSASKYKAQWGGVSHPVYQQVAALGRSHQPESIVGRVQSDGRFGLVRRLWPHLPLPVAQYLGPKLRKHVPFA